MFFLGFRGVGFRVSGSGLYDPQTGVCEPLCVSQLVRTSSVRQDPVSHAVSQRVKDCR